MKFFKFSSQDISIDLGTTNVLIMYKNELVVDEPAIVAFDKHTNKVIAVGRKAMEMEGKTHENIRTVWPLIDGVIADFNAAEYMIREMLKMVNKGKNWGFSSMRMVICIPAGSTEVQKRAIRDSAEIAGAKEIYLIYEPMAAAIGIGLDVEEPVGNMIVDIGGGTTEISVIAMSGIVCDQSIKVAGNALNADIEQYMRKQHNLLIGLPTAEKIKIRVGSVLPELENPPADYAVSGRDLMTGIPKEIKVTYSEIAGALDRSIAKIEEAVLKALEITPPELAGDIHLNGIYLTGGGALLRGLDKRLAAKTGLHVTVVDNALKAVANGTNIALQNIGKVSFLMR